MTRAPSIRTAARPFVARALRGARGRRLVALSALLTALSGVLGIWLALGTGHFERELRDAFGLEESRWSQEHRRFVVFADGEDQAAALRRAIDRRARGEDLDYDDATWSAAQAFDGGLDRLRRAAYTDAPRGREDVQRRAQLSVETLSKIHGPSVMNHGFGGFNWYDDVEVEALTAVIDRGATPAVEVYASPLGPLDALRLAGAFAGGALVLLLLLAAPVLAGTQMAQETHENTLQPLAGSALRADELAIGLTAGPLAIAAVLAAPQLALLLIAAAVAGSLGSALALVGTVLAGGAFLVVLAQLAGLALGKVRSPGLVGGGLAAILGVLGGVGLALAGELTARTAGTLALLPQAAASHALAQTFGLWRAEPGFGAVHDTTAPVVIGALGMLVFAGLGLRALARRIGNTSPVSLRGPEGLAAAVVAMTLVTCANPFNGGWRAEEFYLLNLGVLAVPLAIVLMMRVPTGDVPPTMRRTPVGKLVGEFIGWSALYLAAAAVIAGPGRMHVFMQPVALAYLLWFLAVAALLSLRVTAPMTFASRLWAGVCAAAVAVAFAQTAMWARSLEDFSFRGPPLFVFGELSPLLGLVQAALTIVIPWTLVRALRRPTPVPAG